MINDKKALNNDPEIIGNDKLGIAGQVVHIKYWEIRYF